MKRVFFIISIILISSKIIVAQDTLSILPAEEKSTTSFFVIANWSNTFRKLEENDGLFGDSLGVRSDETSYNRWSFGIGFQSMLNNHLMFEAGMSYMRNGEQYSFSETDTSYIYKSQYSYIAMPIKLYYTFGDRFKVIVGGGVVPQMFMGYKQDLTWESKDQTKGSEITETNQGFNTFVLSTVVNLGIKYDYSPKMSLLFVPEYKAQLNSSFEKNNSFKHFGRSVGFNVGLTYIL